MTKSLKLAALAVFCLVATQAHALFPNLMNYQGRLDDANGVPLADGNYSVTFRLYDAAAGGALLWQETQTVATVDGVFSVMLGAQDTIPQSVFYADSTYLEIQPSGSDPVLPRSLLSVVPYAWRARNADQVGGFDAAQVEESAEILAAIAAHAAVADAHHDKTIDASELSIGTLAESRLPQGAIDSSEIEVESIGATRLIDEPGIAHAYTTSVLLSSTLTQVDSVTVIVPKAGWILVMASGYFIRDHTLGSGNCAATVSLSTSRTTHSSGNSAKFSVVSSLPSGAYVNNFNVTRVLQVNAGATKVYLLGDAVTGNPFPRVENINLNAVYFPTAYGNIENLAQ
ncbi:MAG TPA: hypothetical protein VNN55_02760 [bacterium]|nr:hypothetical protein [bacterium]